MKWFLLAISRYAEFEGRSCRKEFWAFTIVDFAVNAILFFIFMQMFLLDFLEIVDQLISQSRNSQDVPVDPKILFDFLKKIMPKLSIWCAISFLFNIIMLIPSFSVAVRRIHDIGKSGLLVLLVFIPWVGGLIILIFGCIPGNVGPNEFGPDPSGQGPQRPRPRAAQGVLRARRYSDQYSQIYDDNEYYEDTNYSDYDDYNDYEKYDDRR